MLSNNLWCIVERVNGGEYVIPEEVFMNRYEARNYLREQKQKIVYLRNKYKNLEGMGGFANPKNLYIRKLSISANNRKG